MKKQITLRWVATSLVFGLLASNTCGAMVSSVKAMGVAGATTAYAQDAAVAAYNPALGLDVENRWDLGVTATYWKKETTIRGDKYSATRDVSILPDFGLNYVYNDCWAFGIAVFNRDYFKTHYRRALSDFGTSHARFDYQQGTIQLRLTHRIAECHVFGASLDIHLSRFKLDGFENFATSAHSTYPTAVTGRGYDYSNGYGFTLGWLWHASECVDLGTSFSNKVEMRQFDRYRGILATRDIDVPAVWRIGAAYRPTRCLTLLADFEYIWNGDILSLNNDFSGTIAGSREGPGFAWRDTYLIKAGVEYAVNSCLDIRLGYRFERCRFGRDKAGTYLNVLVVQPMEHFATVGLTYVFDCMTEISFFGEWGFNRSVKGSIQTIGEFIGSGEFNNKGTNASLGLSIGRRF